MANPDFERHFECAAWLIDKLSSDHDLLRQFMGGVPERAVNREGSNPIEAMREIEREAAEHGWRRVDVETALRLVQLT